MATSPAPTPTRRRPVPPDPELDARRRAAARIPLTPPGGAMGRLLAWYSRRAYGDVLDSGLALAQNRRVLRASLAHERKVAKFDVLDPTLRSLAELAATPTTRSPTRSGAPRPPVASSPTGPVST